MERNRCLKLLYFPLLWHLWLSLRCFDFLIIGFYGEWAFKWDSERRPTFWLDEWHVNIERADIVFFVRISMAAKTLVQVFKQTETILTSFLYWEFLRYWLLVWCWKKWKYVNNWPFLYHRLWRHNGYLTLIYIFIDLRLISVIFNNFVTFLYMYIIDTNYLANLWFLWFCQSYAIGGLVAKRLC